MSGSLDILQLDKSDVVKFLASGTHLGATNINFQMIDYVYKRKPDGTPSSNCLVFICTQYFKLLNGSGCKVAIVLKNSACTLLF